MRDDPTTTTTTIEKSIETMRQKFQQKKKDDFVFKVPDLPAHLKARASAKKSRKLKKQQFIDEENEEELILTATSSSQHANTDSESDDDDNDTDDNEKEEMPSKKAKLVAGDDGKKEEMPKKEEEEEEVVVEKKPNRREENDEIESTLLCSICNEIMHDCISLQPCLHSYCSGCYSEWMSKSLECPVCRVNVSRISKNHIVNNLINAYLKANPDKRRPEDELKELDSKNKITKEIVSQQKKTKIIH